MRLNPRRHPPRENLTEVAGGWLSPGGHLLSHELIARLDLAALAQMYAAEETGAPFPTADSAVWLAWRYGYANPRTASLIEETA